MKKSLFFTSLIAFITTVLYLPAIPFFAIGWYLPHFFLFTFSPLATLVVLPVFRKKRFATKLLIYMSSFEIFAWLLYVSLSTSFDVSSIFTGIGAFLLCRASLALIAGVFLYYSSTKKSPDNMSKD